MKIVKNFKSMILLFMCVFSLNAAEQSKFELLQNPIKMENSVVEIFYYGCQHCYMHHKRDTLGKMQIKLPHLKYYTLPYTFASQDGFGLRELYAYAQFQDDQSNLSVSEEKSKVRMLNDAFFDLVFNAKKQEINDEILMQKGLQILKISKQELLKFGKSEEAKKILNLYEQVQNIAKFYGGVPIFIVNGKFKINIEQIQSLQELIDLSEQLSKNE